ncbi:MAG: sigma-70 family RNA polymerase sigma factor [Phycisphaerales bacterium]
MPSNDGDLGTEAQPFEQLYDDLRRLAGSIFAEQHAGHTLQPTAIINEAWLKLCHHTDGTIDRVHFLALAAKAMRQVLTDHARAKGRLKRGGGDRRIRISENGLEAPETGFDPADLHEALAELERLNERHAHVTELRLFGCLSVSEIADLLGVGEATVKRDWAFARLWLAQRLGPED